MYPNSFSFLLISFIVTVYSFNVISLAFPSTGFPVIPSCSLYFTSFSFSRSWTFSAIGVIFFCNSRSASSSGEFTLALFLTALVFGFLRVKLNFSAFVRSPVELFGLLMFFGLLLLEVLNFGTARALAELFAPILYLLGVSLVNLFRNVFLCSALSTALLPKFFGAL